MRTYARVSGKALLPGDIPVHYDIRALPVAAAKAKDMAAEMLMGATGEKVSILDAYQTRDTYTHDGKATTTVTISYEMKGTPIEYEIAPPYCGEVMRNYGTHMSFAKAVVLDRFGVETAVCGLHEKMYLRRQTYIGTNVVSIRPLGRMEWGTFRENGTRRA